MRESGLIPRSVRLSRDRRRVIFQFLVGTRYADMELFDNGSHVVLLEDLTDRKETIFEFDNTPESIRGAVNRTKDFLMGRADQCKSGNK